MGKRIKYEDYVGDIKDSKEYGQFTILRYNGMYTNRKHYFTIQFKDTDNIEDCVEWSKIRKGTCKDLEFEKLKKKMKKAEDVRKRNMLQNAMRQEAKKRHFPIGRKKMKVLALDMSTVSTGYALFRDTEILKYGSITYMGSNNRNLTNKIRKDIRSNIPTTQCFGDETSKDMLMDARLSVMYKFINKLIHTEHPDMIIIEDTYLTNVNTLKTLMLLQGYIHGQCLLKGIPMVKVMPSCWQEYWNMERNRAKIKEKSIKTAEIITKTRCYEDTSDALLLGMYAVSELDDGSK